MASNFGQLIQSVGASWMMVSLGASPQMVALVQASTTLPIMLFSLVAGALADNLERRYIMLGAQIFMLLVSTVLAVFAFLHLLTPWVLLSFTFLVGCATAIYSPSWQASVGDMVPRPLLSGAVALNSMGFNIARSIGPALGGAIVAAGGAAAAFLINALSYVGVIAVLARWRPERAARVLPRERVPDAIAAGIRYTTMSPILLTVLLRGGLFGLAASGVSAMMPLVARDLVKGGAFTYGVLLGAFGVGAVIGALAQARLRSRYSTEMIVRIGIALVGMSSIATAFSHSLPLTVLALMAGGVGWVLTLSSFNVTVQLASPRWVVGRTLSLYQMFTFGGMAAGAWIAGIIADHHGVSTTLVASGLVAFAGIALGFRLPLPQIADLDLDPVSRWHEPEPAFQITPRSGPVVISIEYRIDEGDVQTFLNAMSERRRIRIRDGARRWRLTRDLADGALWTELYEFPTWTEYVRHNERRTHADLPSWQALDRLHRGDAPPLVRRRIERQVSLLPWSHGRDPHPADLGAHH